MHRRIHADAAPPSSEGALTIGEAPFQRCRSRLHRQSEARARECPTVRAPLARAARCSWTRLPNKRDTRRQRRAEKARLQGEAKREWQRTGEVGRPPTLVGPGARSNPASTGIHVVTRVSAASRGHGALRAPTRGDVLLP